MVLFRAAINCTCTTLVLYLPKTRNIFSEEKKGTNKLKLKFTFERWASSLKKINFNSNFKDTNKIKFTFEKWASSLKKINLNLNFKDTNKL